MTLQSRIHEQASLNGDYRIDRIRAHEARMRLYAVQRLDDWYPRIKAAQKRRERNCRLFRGLCYLTAALAGVLVALYVV